MLLGNFRAHVRDCRFATYSASAGLAGGMNDRGRVGVSEGTAVFATQRCFVLLALR
jgi:hypothetical protein